MQEERLSWHSVYYWGLRRAFRDVFGYRTGLNRFHVVFSYFLERSNDVMEFSTLTKRNTSPIFNLLADWNLADECSCMQREKRSRACKLYDAYRIVALYRELFDVCRFASTPTYSLFRHESARTPGGQKVKRSRLTKTPSLSGTFERSHGIFHKHREVKRSKGQGQTSFPAKCV